MKHGDSLGFGVWVNDRHVGLRPQANFEKLILDDQIYVFDDPVRRAGAFSSLTTADLINPVEFLHPVVYPVHLGMKQCEWFHSLVWKNRGIELEVIGIDCIFEKNGTESGDLEGFPP